MCYKRYLFDYKFVEILVKNKFVNIYDVKILFFLVECVFNEIVEVERNVFWWCYFDIYCFV